MELAGIPDTYSTKSTQARFTDDQAEKIKESIMKQNNAPFQLPIRAEKGSIILWFSTTIHSAMSATCKETSTRDDPFKGWRGVVYVCYRPKPEFSFHQLEVLKDCLENNLGTNHWATKVYSLTYKGKHARKQMVSPNIKRLVDEPRLVYEIVNFKPNNDSCLVNETLGETDDDGPGTQELDQRDFHSNNSGAECQDGESSGTEQKLNEDEVLSDGSSIHGTDRSNYEQPQSRMKQSKCQGKSKVKSSRKRN